MPDLRFHVKTNLKHCRFVIDDGNCKEFLQLTLKLDRGKGLSEPNRRRVDSYLGLPNYNVFNLVQIEQYTMWFLRVFNLICV